MAALGNPTAGHLTSLNTTAQQLSSNQLADFVVIQNDPASTVSILVGDVNNQYFTLSNTAAPLALNCQNLNSIYVKAASNTTNTNCNFLSFQQ
jgi:hypothetical protein